MIVRKVRGQDEIEKIILSRSEFEFVHRKGFSLDEWVKIMLISIAKKRKWKWYLNKDKNTREQ